MKRVGRKLGAGVFVLVLVLLSCSVVFADFIAYEVAAPANGTQSFSGSVGMDFNVNSSLRITEMGAFDSGQNGFSRNITVAIFDRDTKNIVAGTQAIFSTNVSYSHTGGSAFQTITPILLSAGGHYSIVAWNYGDEEKLGNTTSGGGNFDPKLLSINGGGGLITFLTNNRYATNPGVFPGTDYPAPEYTVFAAGTFKFAAVPVPPSVLLMGSGLLGLVMMRRKRNLG